MFFMSVKNIAFPFLMAPKVEETVSILNFVGVTVAEAQKTDYLPRSS